MTAQGESCTSGFLLIAELLLPRRKVIFCLQVTIVRNLTWCCLLSHRGIFSCKCSQVNYLDDRLMKCYKYVSAENIS